MRGIGPAQHGVLGGIRFETRVHVRRVGGRQTVGHDGIRIEDADEVILLVTTATSFRRFDDVGGDPSAIARADIAAAKAKSWPDLLAAHQAEHRRLFRRVSIDLGRSPAADLPTDQRIARSADLDDPALAALYYQFGRYLLISSSRPGTQPANLQGIWNERTTPPWESKWTLNINAEMNYWLADSGNLGELIEPLLRLTEDLAITGQRTARNDWGARGWVAYHNTDLFRQATINSAALYGTWPMGGAWLLGTLWDHWDYSRDRDFLARLYPLMASSCLFYLDALVPHPRTGELVMNPSNSPENSHHPGVSICAGPAMDSQLLRDLFSRTIAASNMLGKDAGLRAEIATALAKLPPDKIGKAGQLQEWFEDWDVEAPEINHRHVSHLYALYPGDQISLQRTPALAKAAQRSLEIRGDDATGWGLAWRINLWARLEQRERAYKSAQDAAAAGSHLSQHVRRAPAVPDRRQSGRGERDRPDAGAKPFGHDPPAARAAPPLAQRSRIRTAGARQCRRRSHLVRRRARGGRADRRQRRRCPCPIGRCGSRRDAAQARPGSPHPWTGRTAHEPALPRLGDGTDPIPFPLRPYQMVIDEGRTVAFDGDHGGRRIRRDFGQAGQPQRHRVLGEVHRLPRSEQPRRQRPGAHAAHRDDRLGPEEIEPRRRRRL
jgi:hypothetical protein